MFRRVAHRLYLTAFWLLAIPGMGLLLYGAAIAVHDHPIRERALKCYGVAPRSPRQSLQRDSDAWLDAERVAFAPCNMTVERNIWFRELPEYYPEGLWGPPTLLGSDDEYQYLIWALRPLAALAALVALGRWIRWLARPPSTTP